MNRNTFVANLIAPEPPWNEELAAFPVAVVPVALGALDIRARKYVWDSPDDWRRGRQLIRQLQVGLLMGLGNDLLEINRQTYRMLDAAFNGTSYVVSGQDPVTNQDIITPAIPTVPDSTTIPAQLGDGSLRRRLERLIDLLDNGLNGTTIPDSPSTAPALRDNLEALRLLIENQGTNGEDVERILGEILVALA